MARPALPGGFDLTAPFNRGSQHGPAHQGLTGFMYYLSRGITTPEVTRAARNYEHSPEDPEAILGLIEALEQSPHKLPIYGAFLNDLNRALLTATSHDDEMELWDSLDRPDTAPEWRHVSEQNPQGSPSALRAFRMTHEQRRAAAAGGNIAQVAQHALHDPAERPEDFDALADAYESDFPDAAEGMRHSARIKRLRPTPVQPPAQMARQGRKSRALPGPSSPLSRPVRLAKCRRCEGDGKAYGADRPFESSEPGTYPGPCPVCWGSGKVRKYAKTQDTDGSFDQALQRSLSGDQKAFRQSLDQMAQQLGLPGKSASGIGDWETGAEHSTVRFTKPADMDRLRYLAAWSGLTSNQKSVLVFNPAPSGLDSVYDIQVPDKDLRQVRQKLTQAGVPFRTLIPGKKGTRVLVYDQGRALRPKVAQFAGGYGARVRESIGSGEYLGGGSRSSARAKYRDVIGSPRLQRRGRIERTCGRPPRR